MNHIIIKINSFDKQWNYEIICIKTLTIISWKKWSNNPIIQEMCNVRKPNKRTVFPLVLHIKATPVIRPDRQVTKEAQRCPQPQAPTQVSDRLYYIRPHTQ